MLNKYWICVSFAVKYTYEKLLPPSLGGQVFPRLNIVWRERSGFVLVSRLSGCGFISVTALCPWAKHIYPCILLVQPRKIRPESWHNWKFVDWKVKNQIKHNMNNLGRKLLRTICAKLFSTLLSSVFTRFFKFFLLLPWQPEFCIELKSLNNFMGESFQD